MNKMMVIGNLGRNPDIGKSGVVKFSVATTSRSKDGKEETEWHKIVCFEKLAENCGKYLTKGSKVFVEGRVKTSKYTGKDGSSKESRDIIAAHVEFLSKPETKDNQDGVPAANEVQPGQSVDSLDEIPF